MNLALAVVSGDEAEASIQIDKGSHVICYLVEYWWCRRNARSRVFDTCKGDDCMTYTRNEQNDSENKPWVVDQALGTAECVHLQVIK